MNLADALLGTAVADPERVAIVAPQRLTYAELAELSARLGGVIAERANPGDRVALLAGTEPAFVAAYLAILRSGAIAVPLNPAAPAHELAAQLHTVGATLIVSTDAAAELARRAAAQPEVAADIVLIDADHAAEPLSTSAPRGADDIAVLLFTAGTAGSPKPAMLTHGSLLANLDQMQSHPGLRVHADDVALGVLPLFHIYGMNAVVGLALRAGASLSLIEHFHPAETITRIAADGVTVIAAVPAIFAAWLALDDAPHDTFARVRMCVSGGASLGGEIVGAMRERYGVIVRDGYGLTEASPVVTTAAVVDDPPVGSVGPPLPGVEVRLVDADGDAVLAGDPGEILVRGPNVFAGYWNDPDTTAAVVADGWLHTGDIAVAGDDGWLTLVDRAKDLIIVSGFNVFPGEVEDAIRAHADVDDVAVIGEPHPRTGEAVVAYVVARAGRSPDPVELVRFAARRLA
ncbi:MAG TPA: AMP-binding protein, partial [Acidimicrobiia bacterium]|nr:AMP-binding protein [Acidimicrobiia bacterium]